MVMAGATILALAVRLFTLTRPGFLTQSTEYDDGVYLGAAIRLTQGVLPYKDFAFVQPPGIVLLMTPVALFARLTSTAAGMALARVLTVLASSACIPLAGRLVRHRGTVTTALTCGILAIYPPDIAAAHTLLLEPWMNVLCLAAVNLAFSDGRLAGRTSRLAWAGVIIGVAGSVKFWAGAPAAVLLIICLLDRHAPHWRGRALGYLGGLVAGFGIPVLPFLALGPGTFLRGTIAYQAARTGTYVPVNERLAHITGVIDLLDQAGRLTVSAGANSLFGQAVIADTAPASWSALPIAASAVLVLLVGGGYWAGRRDLRQAEWFALATAVCALAAIIGYSAFFYHYPAFPGPWLAVAAGVALGVLAARIPVQAVRRGFLGLAAAVIVFATCLQVAEVAPLRTPPGADQITRAIPPGACVVSDQVSLLIMANRFEPARPGCPVVIDALATTLSMTGGVSVQAGAEKDRAAVLAWRRILERAQYVWFSPNQWKRVPFGFGTADWAWFTEHFRQIVPDNPDDRPNVYIHGIGELYVPRT
jgi:alpha-1,2-mannosyltransferase